MTLEAMTEYYNQRFLQALLLNFQRRGKQNHILLCCECCEFTVCIEYDAKKTIEHCEIMVRNAFLLSCPHSMQTNI